jgi:hypothetical protein
MQHSILMRDNVLTLSTPAYTRQWNAIARCHEVTPLDLVQQATTVLSLMPVYMLAAMWIGSSLLEIGSRFVQQTISHREKHLSRGS